jgi:transcription elongation factor GreA
MSSKLTQAGYEKLKNELNYLQTTKRREVIEAIATARAHGDLKENAEYDAAKNEQGMLEKRISELDAILSNASIIDDSQIDNSKAYLGATLTLHDLGRDSQIKYMLVSKEEASLKEGKISIESPVGKQLLGKAVDDLIEVTIPAGTLRYKLLKIER